MAAAELVTFVEAVELSSCAEFARLTTLAATVILTKGDHLECLQAAPPCRPAVTDSIENATGKATRTRWMCCRLVMSLRPEALVKRSEVLVKRLEVPVKRPGTLMATLMATPTEGTEACWLSKSPIQLAVRETERQLRRPEPMHGKVSVTGSFVSRGRPASEVVTLRRPDTAPVRICPLRKTLRLVQLLGIRLFSRQQPGKMPGP